MIFLNLFTSLSLSLSLVLILSNIIKIKSSDTECPYSPTNIDDRRTNKNTLRLIQYNVEWMFYNEYSGCPGNSCSWANQSEVLTHMDYISQIINELNPDIVNFCEIEGCDEINMLIERTNSSFNPYLIKGTDTATGQNVGMMTMIDPYIDLYRTENKYEYPISNSKCGYTGSGGNVGISKYFITKFKIYNEFNNEINIAMISVHLLAYPTDKERCAKREAQAIILQEQIFNLINNGLEVILIGDFNDWDNKILDANNNQPISQVLDILKGNIGTYSNQYILKSISDKISKEQRYSEYWDENSNCIVESTEFSMIDHILLTPNLYSMVSNAFSYHKYPHSCIGNTYNSDHDPIIIDFIL